MLPRPGELRIFKPKQYFGSDRRPCYSRGKHCPTNRRGYAVPESPAKKQINPEADEISHRFKEHVGMNAPAPKIQVDGECGGELEGGEDAGL